MMVDMMKNRLMKAVLAALAAACVVLASTGCPGDVVGPPRIVKVAAGGYHTVLLKSDGTVWVTGRNDCGQLGLPGTYSRERFIQVPGLTGIVDVCAASEHTVAVKDDGTVWVTGANNGTQLGLGNDQTDRFGFVRVPGLTDVVAAAAGREHTVVLKRDGTVWGAGWNGSGKLGLGNLDDGGARDAPEFTRLPGIDGGRQLLAGDNYTMVLKSDGTLWGTGRNLSGELGLGDSPTHQFAFTQIPGVTGVRDVAGTFVHTLLVKDDGTVWVTGSNEYGKLGLGAGSPAKVAVFTQVPGITGANKVVAGWNFSFILLRDGGVLAAGRNNDGQLGLGDRGDRNAFERVPGVSGVVAGSAGATHTMLIRGDGELLRTGSNLYGQLGTGLPFGSGTGWE